MTAAVEPPTSEQGDAVVVPAELLTRACLLLGKLPAEHAAYVYVELLACKPADQKPVT
jgi:hypothetical protein